MHSHTSFSCIHRRVFHAFSYILSGFCHFGLVLFMVLWQSPDTPVMSGFSCENGFECAWVVRSLVCVHCFVWSVVFGSRHSCLEFRFVSGFGHSRSIFCHCVSARSRVRSAPCYTVHSCPRVFCCVARSSCFYAACIYVMSCAVLHTAGVFHWLCAFVFSCLVWTRGVSVFSLATVRVLFCTWLVNSLLAMCLCFCFVWACGFMRLYVKSMHKLQKHSRKKSHVYIRSVY